MIVSPAPLPLRRLLQDSDGDINAKELGDIMRAMGYNPSESDMKEMMENVDKKRIRFEQFKKTMLQAIKVDRYAVR